MGTVETIRLHTSEEKRGIDSPELDRPPMQIQSGGVDTVRRKTYLLLPGHQLFDEYHGVR